MKRYKVIQMFVNRNAFNTKPPTYHVVVQFDTGYYFTGTYDLYGLKLDQGGKYMSLYDAEKKLIEMHF